MTVLTGRSADAVVLPARAYAVLTWAYAAGFGVPAVPVAIYLLRRGSLPWFGDLFPMYGGPWSGRFRDEQFVGLLLSYLGLVGVVAWAAGRVRRGCCRSRPCSGSASRCPFLGSSVPAGWRSSSRPGGGSVDPNGLQPT